MGLDGSWAEVQILGDRLVCAAGDKAVEDLTFTQAELDQIINDRLAQQAKNRFGDYADLKAKAEGAKTVEQQLADDDQADVGPAMGRKTRNVEP